MSLRNILIGVAILLVIVAGGLAIALGNVDRFRPRIQAELQDKLNRPVTLGKLSLKLLPLQIKVDGFSIGENPAFSSTRPFATAATVFTSASLFSILRGNPEVKTLVLDKPEIELIKNSHGAWNFSSLGQSSSGSSGKSSFSLGLLKINDGQIGYTDESKKLPRSVYDHIDLKLTDFAPNKQFGLDLGVHFPGDGKQTAEFNGKVGPLSTTASSETEIPPVTGHLSIQQVSLAGVNRFAAGTLPENTDGVASGEADVTSTAGVLNCKGNLKLENSTIKGSKIDYPISATYDLQEDTKQRKLLVRSGVFELGPTSFVSSGSVDMAPTPVALNLQMKTDNSSVTELAKLAGSFGFGFNPDYKVSGKVSANVSAKGPATSPQLNGSIVAQSLEASGGEIKQPVDIPEIDLTLTPDSIMSNTFTARSGSTALSLAFTLSQYSNWNTTVDATAKTDGAVDIGELLNIAKAYGIDGTKGVTGAGKLALDVHVKGPTANPSAMSYAGSANISSATFSTPELTKPLTITSAEGQFSQNSVSLGNLAASIGSMNLKGSLSAHNFSAPQVAFNLSADKIDTDELQRLPAPVSSQPAPIKKSKDKPKPSMLQMVTGSGTIAAGEIKASDIVLKDVNAKCLLDHGVIQLSPLSAGIFNGRASGTLSADMRPAAPQMAAKLKFSDVDANSLLSAVSSMKNTVSGSLSANTDLRFALVSSNDLARTLNGTISFDLANGVIRNINLISEVEKVGKFLKSAGSDSTSADGGTAVKKFAGTLNILNGVASTNNLTGVLNAGTLTGQGTLNLASQDINMHINTVLGNSVSQSVGGSGIGGYLSTALSNGKGELVVPVLVTGNMAKPSVKPDTAAMAKLKLGNILPTSGGGAASQATGLLNGILGGGKQQSTPDGKQAPAQNPLGSILDQFKKKKPEPAKPQ